MKKLKQIREDIKWFIPESMKYLNKPRWWVLLHPFAMIKFCILQAEFRKNIAEGHCFECSHEEEV